MKKVSSIIAAVALMIGAACTTASAAAQKKEAPKMKDWTVAVFLNADNNLDPFGVEDQEEMARIGSNENLNIVTLIDREYGPAQINYIEKNKIRKIKDMGELDMGDYNELVKFCKFIKENYPAKHYSIGLWNHGSGWKAKTDSRVVRGISYDDSSNNHITTNELSTATKLCSEVLGQKLDIINMDACLMGMVEVAHELKDNCLYFVGSEEVEPGKGAPYDDVLRGVKAGISPRDFADHWINAFAKSYQNGSQGRDDSTQSAIDLSKIDALETALDGFAKAVMSTKHADEVVKAVAKTVKFEYPENIDLMHFIKNFKALCAGDASIVTACDKVMAAAKAAVVNSKTTSRSSNNRYKDATGLAIYLPQRLGMETAYTKLNFAKSSMWDDMILALRNQAYSRAVVEAAKKGDFKEMKKAIATAKKDPRDASVRALVRELNTAAYVENQIPASSQAEFDRLFKNLKSALQSR